MLLSEIFLSTLSLRRATSPTILTQLDKIISIHALLAESDVCASIRISSHLYFYPRSPCGERQIISQMAIQAIHISIHALLAESDRGAYRGARQSRPHFYPRSPCGERRFRLMMAVFLKYFYPRSPCGERLVLLLIVPKLITFLSTLSLRRATWYPFGYFGCNCYFYPRSPCGERQSSIEEVSKYVVISIHALLAESDLIDDVSSGGMIISIHALLAESDYGFGWEV